MTDEHNDRFHMHLEVCPQCADNPFSLCRRGRLLLDAAVQEVSAALSAHTDQSGLARVVASADQMIAECAHDFLGRVCRKCGLMPPRTS